MTWKIRQWCNDCTGVDPQGCFDGGDYVLEEEFETKEAAEAHGYTLRQAPWDWEAFEEAPQVETTIGVLAP